MLRRLQNSVTDFNFYLVFVTKHRKPVFTTDELRSEMETILKNIAKNKGVDVTELKVTPDHVHMFISFSPVHSPSAIVKSLKGTSARMWFKTHPETKKNECPGHLWSPSYFMSTIGNVSKEIVRRYIEEQMKKTLSQN